MVLLSLNQKKLAVSTIIISSAATHAVEAHSRSLRVLELAFLVAAGVAAWRQALLALAQAIAIARCFGLGVSELALLRAVVVGANDYRPSLRRIAALARAIEARSFSVGVVQSALLFAAILDAGTRPRALALAVETHSLRVRILELTLLAAVVVRAG